MILNALFCPFCYFVAVFFEATALVAVWSKLSVGKIYFGIWRQLMPFDFR